MNQKVTMKEIPSADRPYEKCEKLGAGALSDTELLAVLLRTGTRGENALELASRILYQMCIRDSYMTAIDKYNLLSAVGWTVFITVGSVLVILVCTSMCAWYITRVKSKFTKMLYLLCVFSMVVPFQMVMFTLSLVADRTGLRTPLGIIIIYLGFGAGLAVFMFCGFVKSIPIEIEEATMIDGCTPIRTFFSVVLPIMKPTYISVGILETMWIWNDFLLPYLVLDLNKYKTISIAIQYMKGSYGRVDMLSLIHISADS